MAPRKKKEVTEEELDKSIEALVEEQPKPGIVKEYMQNGLRYQRIRKEDGSMVDVRI